MRVFKIPVLDLYHHQNQKSEHYENFRQQSDFKKASRDKGLQLEF